MPLLVTTAAHAQDSQRWYLQTSLHTTHYESKPYHNNNQPLVGLEHYLVTDEDMLMRYCPAPGALDRE